MKTTIRTIALAALVAVAPLSQTVIAQTGEHAMKVNVPFAFEIGKQHFLPGVYTFVMANPNLLSVRSGDRSGWAMIQRGYDSTHRRSGYVVFRNYGDRYFLAEYVPSTGFVQASVFRSAQERKAARDYAANNISPHQVELAMMSDIGLPGSGN